jgi:hypothetical protein
MIISNVNKPDFIIWHVGTFLTVDLKYYSIPTAPAIGNIGGPKMVQFVSELVSVGSPRVGT